MNSKYEEPAYEKEGFTCPNCSAYTQHSWKSTLVNETFGDFCGRYNGVNSKQIINTLNICKCSMCGYISFWYKDKLIWPLNSSIPSANSEMPDDVKKLYDEAKNIIELSPKGSCAILRLALQKLCNQLANKKETTKIDVAIAELVKNGLPTSLQQAMDTVRIVGNDAVHPGEINVDDNKEIAYMMFKLINFIVEKMVVEPKVIEAIYNTMPEDKLKGIENRDKKDA